MATCSDRRLETVLVTKKALKTTLRRQQPTAMASRLRKTSRHGVSRHAAHNVASFHFVILLPVREADSMPAVAVDVIRHATHTVH